MIRLLTTMLLLIGCLLVTANQGLAQQDDSADARVLSVAPDPCLYFGAWNPPPASAGPTQNHTEQLLAEPEVESFFREVRARIEQGIPLLLDDQPAPVKNAATLVVNNLIDAFWKKSGAVFVEDVSIDPAFESVQVAAALIVQLDEQVPPTLDAVFELLNRASIGTTQVEIQGHDFLQIDIPDSPLQSRLLIGGAGEHLLVCLGQSTAANALDRLADQSRPQWLSDLLVRTNVPRQTSVGYFDIKEIVDRFLPLAGPEAEAIADQLGIRSLASLESATGLDQTGTINKVSLRFDGSPTGLFSLADGKPINWDQLKHFPQDTLFAFAVALDTEKILQTLRDLADQTDPSISRDLNRGLSEFREVFGLDLEQDLLDLLGPTVAFHQAAGDGWLVGMTLSVEVADIDQLRANQSQFIDHLQGNDGLADLPFWIDTQQFDGTDIHTIRFVEFPFPVEPSWCFQNDRMLISLAPQSLRPVISPHPEDAFLPVETITGQQAGDSQLLALAYADAKQQFSLAYMYLQLLKPMLSASMAGLDDQSWERREFMNRLAALTPPSARSIYRHLLPSITVVTRTEDGITTETRQTMPSINVAVASPIMVALLLPAVQAARAAARRTQSANNIRMQMLAVHNFESVYRRLPAGFSTDESGQPLLSWRVHLLPYMELEYLYEEFHLDEPWDSDHNIQLLDRMPDVYRSPVSQASPGKTVYRGIGGTNGIFTEPVRPGSNLGTDFATVRDGTSNTIAIAETGDALAIEWTRPDVIDADDFEIGNIFANYPNGSNFGFADGSVRFVHVTVPKEIIGRLFNKADGEPIPWSEFE